MTIDYPGLRIFLRTLRQTPDNSVDALVVISGALKSRAFNVLKEYLDESVRVLKKGGLLFIQGRPDYLPEVGVYLDKHLTFKYWIAVKSALQKPTAGLPSTHAAVLLFTKGRGRYNLRRVRFPHERCAYCGKYLRDWGGKTHLMHPEGYAISDVWASLTSANNYTQLSAPVLDTVIKMIGFEGMGIYNQRAAPLFDELTSLDSIEKRIIVGPEEGVASINQSITNPVVQYHLPGFGREIKYSTKTKSLGHEFWNVVRNGDAVEILNHYPDNSVDLVFADPPYNLDKEYNLYDDEKEGDAYLDWCNAWLQEYIRILKPNGSLYLLNLPRWTMHHAAFLSRYLYFQNWIVWNALSEPRGKLMPAHYGLLFYTKSPTDFTFNYDQVKEVEPRCYCLRSSCIRKRKNDGADEKDLLTDIWSDIHRLKHRRDRDYHPCQLPDEIMERIIRLSTNEGDIVLDALVGAGTTAVIAARLGRRYVAIDIDDKYVQITKDKLAQVELQGYVERKSIRRSRPKHNKKALQEELRAIASRLGRLPTPEDVQAMSAYGLEAFLETFPTWGKAIKAAKLEFIKK